MQLRWVAVVSPVIWGHRLDYSNGPTLYNFMLILSCPWKLGKSTGFEVWQTGVNALLPSMLFSGPIKVSLRGFGCFWKLTAVWLKGNFSCNKTSAVSRTLQSRQMDQAKAHVYNFLTPVAHLMCFCRLRFCCLNNSAPKAGMAYWSPCCWFCCSQGVAWAFQTGLPATHPCSPLAVSVGFCSPHTPAPGSISSTFVTGNPERHVGSWHCLRGEKENDGVLDENMGEMYPNSWSSSISSIWDCFSWLSRLLAQINTRSWLVFNRTQICANQCFCGRMLVMLVVLQDLEELLNRQHMNKPCSGECECRYLLT